MFKIVIFERYLYIIYKIPRRFRNFKCLIFKLKDEIPIQE